MKELLLLNMANGVGSVKTKALLDYFGSPENIFKANPAELMNVAGIGRKISENILNVSRDRGLLLEKEFNLIEKHGVKAVTIFDDGYPVNLKQIYDPPIVLYVKGNLKPDDKLAIAIVGSRRCSHYGSQASQRLAAELAGLGITVVSGMARGIDTAAHNGALNAGGRTIAVLGSGLANIYPPENKKLAEKIAQSGAIISEFPMTAPPLAENFPRRNRIISGLSLGAVVVEAAKDSGALITARCALEQGREVFSVPGQAGAGTAFGTNQLIRDGAKLVETARDILEELAPLVKDCLDLGGLDMQGMPGQKTPMPANLKSEELKILEALGSGPLYIDQIVEDSEVPVSATSSALTGLEIRGLVKRLPGNVFARS